MLVVLIRHEDYLSVPVTLTDKVTDVLLAGRTSMYADYCHKVIKRSCLRRKRSGSRILQKEFLDTLSCIFGSEHSLLLLVARAVEDDSLAVSNAVLLSPVTADVLNCFLRICRKVSLA